MITKITAVEELKQIFIEILVNKTDKVTKVSDNSVLNGIAYGVAKVGQKALKDIALVETHLFPDSGYGDYLDAQALNNGVAPRLGPSQSSTYIVLFGQIGTQYIQGTHTFVSTTGIIFDLEETVTIPNEGFTYTKIRSQDVGEKTNTDPLTINKVNPQPAGHQYVINEYKATGGRDAEDDTSFRDRIKNSLSLLSKGTLGYIEQQLMLINSNVLNVRYKGVNTQGKTVLTVISQNGIDFTPQEFDGMLLGLQDKLNLCDLKPYSLSGYQIQLENVNWQPIEVVVNSITKGVDFRIELFPGYSPDDVRKDIQTRINKYLDFRYWKPGQKVEWEDLFLIIKTTKGVKYLPDQYFYPRIDMPIHPLKLPRLKSFIMRDLEGNIMSNISGTYLTVFYPNNQDSIFVENLG